jgi:hypothetical protein
MLKRASWAYPFAAFAGVRVRFAVLAFAAGGS